MNAGQYIPLADQPLYTWIGGTIREIAIYPPEADFRAGDYLFWIGTAIIDQSAAYSDFSGFDRLHVPLEGNGLRLHFDEPPETVELANFDQYTFDGGRPLRGELIDGPVLAFNIIMKAGMQARISMVTVDQNSDLLKLDGSISENFNMVYVVNGTISLKTSQAGGEQLLNPGDAFVLNQDETLKAISINKQSDVIVLVVSVSRNTL